MRHPFFGFFKRERPYIDPDSSLWPHKWRTVRWKSYERYPKILLPKPRLPEITLENVIRNRHSSREFSGSSLSLHEISPLLFYSCGLVHPDPDLNRSRRAYPSGGGLYPLELYPFMFFGSQEISPGAYHYNVLEHCLERLPVEDADIARAKNAFHYPWAAHASLVLVFSFVEERSKAKYGDFSYKLGLLEAGHVSENVYLNCAALGLKCCALGDINDDALVHNMLNLDGMAEVAFYAIAIGK